MLCDTDVKGNLYWSESKRQLEEMTEDNTADAELKMISRAWKKYGHWTGRNRSAMFELLFQHVNVCKDILCTEYLVNDICQLVKTSTGKIEADKGQHDDSLMSYLIAIYTFYTGDNLAYFGIYRDENPIYKLVEDGVRPEEAEDKVNDVDVVRSINNKYNDQSYNSIAMMSIASDEIRTKELVNRFNFVHDDTYSRMRDKYGELQDRMVSIPASFFDQINGI